MAKLLLVSNRLPVTLKVSGGRADVVPSTGGLATGLSGPHRRSEGLWVGWPGDVSRLDAASKEEIHQKLEAMRLWPVYLDPAEVQGFYEGFSNRVLWPLFHYLLDHIPVGAGGWETYRSVNQRFADVVAKHYRPGDLVWVHDYQLCLVPGLLRERIPEARIGFFLHIPFPSSEVLQALPWRKELLDGLLGADLVGFHTFAYVRHFASALLRLSGLTPQVDRVEVNGREVRFGVFPMGVDARAFSDAAQRPEVVEAARRIREEAGGQRILLGVDRLDYTKGIRRRVLALERLLEREPSLHRKVKLVQIAVPSRTSIEEYESFREEVDEVVGRINGLHGDLSWVPVHNLYRGFSQDELVAFYRAADVMLVTPLRDGMNLVAKEFVASRPDERGVLLLSELAGAAAELGEAVHVNPYDVDGMVDALVRALSMDEDEQRIRMRALRRRVLDGDVHQWVQSFLDALEAACRRGPGPPAPTGRAELAAVMRRVAESPSRLLLLDLDGTLVSFGRVPELVGPDAELRRLLADLAGLPSTRVHLVSGRHKDQLERWFGDLPVSLHAEHGFWSRAAPGEPWTKIGDFPEEWKAKVRDILLQFARRTPGAFVEEKTSSLGWHYRMADPELGRIQSQELLLVLHAAFANAPVEVVSGDKVLEVRPLGINKGLVLGWAMALAGPLALPLAMGDDRTDEDLFAALPEHGIAIHVGPRESAAPYRVPDVRAARRFLRELAEEVAARSSELSPAPS